MTFRDRFRALFESIAQDHPPRDQVDPDEMADMPSTVIEGGMILARGMGEPQVLVRQVLLAQIGAMACPLANGPSARQKGT